MRMTTTLHANLTPEKNSFSIAPGTTTSVSIGQPRSPWHSPVPYLFGGLAAMLGLIAFALLILACSYWRLSRDDAQQQSNEGGDLESGEKGDGICKMNGAPVFEDKIVVIMAGNDKPTFLATPALMLMSKTNNSNDDDHLKLGSNITDKDDGAKDNTSVGDDDDEKPKEDEPTHPHD